MARIDWQAVCNDFRAGQLSVRAIATKHRVSESGIRHRAKAEGWQRDLSQHVRHATAGKLLRSESAHLDALPADDSALVDAAASDNVALIMEHRQAIARWKAISNRLAHTLEHTDVGDVGLADFARSLNSGIDALGKCIRLERQAFGLDGKAQDNGAQTFEQLMQSVAPLTDDELDERIVRLSAKLQSDTLH